MRSRPTGSSTTCPRSPRRSSMPEPVARPPLIYDFTHEALGERLESLGAEAYRISQVWVDLYRHGIDDPAKMRTLPAALRSTLQEHFRFRSLTEGRVFRSTDR